MWQEFLPEDSIIMGRAGPAPKIATPVEPARTENLPPEIRDVPAEPGLAFVSDQLHPDCRTLLNKMIQAMGFNPESVLVHDLSSTPAELSEIPRQTIVALGHHACQKLMNLSEQSSVPEIRGQVLESNGRTVFPTFHPQFLISNPTAKRDAWTDLKKVAAHLKQQNGESQ